MKRNYSEIPPQHIFVQSLRNSLNFPKLEIDNQYIPEKIDQKRLQRHKMEPPRSLSNSNRFKLCRKKSVNDLKQKEKPPKCYLINDTLQFNLDKIYQIDSGQLNVKKTSFQNKYNADITKLKKLKIIIQLVQKISNQKYQCEYKQKECGNIHKMQISLYELSFQDLKVQIKKTFPINLQDLQNKSFLQINIHSNFQVKDVSLNGVRYSIQKFHCKNVKNQNQILILNPWQVIQRHSLIIKNRISLDRSKSKIKWAVSQQNQSKLNNSPSDIKKSQVQQNHYGINMHQSSKMSSSFIYCSPQKKIETISMSSTIQEQRNSLKNKSEYGSNLKRKNNMISSFEINQYKRTKQNQHKKAKQNQDTSISSNRSRSSFRNLKQKNDYFQMKQSQRKKSLKKNLQQSISSYQNKNFQLTNSQRSSQIRLQYGIL